MSGLASRTLLSAEHDERVLQNETAKGKLPEQLETSEDPNIAALRARFGRFSDVASSENEVGRWKFGNVEMSAKLLLSKLRWGVLGQGRTPAAIIFMDFMIRQPEDTTLDSSIIKITVSDCLDPDKSSMGFVRITDYYGPTQLSSTKIRQRYAKNVTPDTPVLGQGVGGFGTGRNLPQYKFSGHISASLGYIWYNNVSWHLVRVNPLSRGPLKHPEAIYHVAFTIEYGNVHEFYLTTSISGKIP